jgi:hypothetical protein
MGAIRLALAVAPLRRVRSALAVGAARPARAAASPGAVARAVARAARVVPGATCLVQSLALQRLLARRGHRARLRLGFEKAEGGSFRGHAWIEAEDAGLAAVDGALDWPVLRSAGGDRGSPPRGRLDTGSARPIP